MTPKTLAELEAAFAIARTALHVAADDFAQKVTDDDEALLSAARKAVLADDLVRTRVASDTRLGIAGRSNAHVRWNKP